MSYLYYNTSSGECQEFNTEELLYITHTEQNRKRQKAIIAAYKNIIKETKSKTYMNKLKSVEQCGTYYHFKRYANGTTECVAANRCKDRYCSYCNWVEARKKRRILMIAADNLKEKYQHLNHITITLPNVTADKLNKQVNVLHSLITRALRHFGIKDYYRSTEITYNKNDNTYHPHAHIMVLKYVKVEDLSSYLGRLYKDHDPTYQYNFLVCWATGKSLVTELTKYITKPDEFPDESINDLIKYEALKGVRFNASAGVVKEEYAAAKRFLKNIDIKEKVAAAEHPATDISVAYINGLWHIV